MSNKKVKGDYMEEKKKDSKKEEVKDRVINNILLVVILILLVYILFATGIIKINTTSKTPPKDKDLETIEEKTTLKTTDEVVTSLYKGVELGRSYNALRHYYFYSYDKLLVNYMDDAFIKEMALSRLTLQDDSTLDATILKDQFLSIVGNNTTYKDRTFQTQCSTYKYDSTKNIYNVIKNQTCETITDNNNTYFDKITKAYKYSDRIEIITSVGYAEEEKELVSDGVYQSTGKTIIKKDMDSSEVIGTYTENLDQIKKKIDYNKLTEYKYTFRLDSNKYYFYSVEKIVE